MFSDIIGQEKIKERLIRSVHEGRIPHAQLFVGPSGVGKLQLAIAYAQYINCTNRSEKDACGVCPSCLKFKTLEHPDLHFVFPIEKKGSRNPVCDDFVADFRSMIRNHGYFDLSDWQKELGVTKQLLIYANESDEIIRKLNFKSYEGNYKFMIIWLPEKMNVVCANKILKTLEEPAEKTVLLLVSEQPDQLLTTIRSRTQTIQIPTLASDDIEEALKNKFPTLSNAAVHLYAHTSNGSYLKARRLVEKDAETETNLQQFIFLMRKAWLVGNKKDYAALQELRNWSETASSDGGRDAQKNFLAYAQHLLRENFIYNFHKPELNYMTLEEQRFSANFSPFVNERNVEQLMEEFALAERHIEQNVNSKIVLFDLVLKVIVLLKM